MLSQFPLTLADFRWHLMKFENKNEIKIIEYVVKVITNLHRQKGHLAFTIVQIQKQPFNGVP